MTQLSGPEIVWWLAGMTCTPNLTLGKLGRSQGPVTIMPMWPLLKVCWILVLVVSM